MLWQSPETEAHDKMLDNNPDRIGILKCWFFEKNDVTYIIQLQIIGMQKLDLSFKCDQMLDLRRTATYLN